MFPLGPESIESYILKRLQARAHSFEAPLLSESSDSTSELPVLAARPAAACSINAPLRCEVPGVLESVGPADALQNEC